MNVARPSLALSLFAVALSFAPQHAAAQSTPFCGGVIVADSFASTMSSSAKQAAVEYFVQLRNTNSVAVDAMVVFSYGDMKHFVSRKVSGTQRFAPNESKQVVLGVETINNPSGAGKLSNAAIKPFVKVTCANLR